MHRTECTDRLKRCKPETPYIPKKVSLYCNTQPLFACVLQLGAFMSVRILNELIILVQIRQRFIKNWEFALISYAKA